MWPASMFAKSRTESEIRRMNCERISIGTIRISATFPNPGNVLRPGQYGRIRAQTAVRPQVLLVPQRAVSELQGSYQVAVVGADNRVEIRPVQMGARIETLWVVTKGLAPGDRIVVEGTQKVKAGVTVDPRPAPAEPPAPLTPGQTAGTPGRK